ncbi:MAG TPA: ATP-binding protein [Tepidisphaeraceae bacterium]|jgi:signal transduction histidine kinase/ActR/RegA family two-component response regulator|nr:ATP-binding protein [Tepidisphaeraceae bacterium]
MHPELEHFVRVLPEPCFLVSGAGEVLLANAAAAGMTGVEAVALKGTRLATLMADPEQKVQDFLRLCARSRQFVPGSFTWLGRVQPLEMRCDGVVIAPRTDALPAMLFVRCRPKAEATDQFVLLNRKIADLSREVLERRKAEQQRDELLQSERAARVEAERNSRMKDEFLATLSHELRTPLNAILGWAQLLQHDRTPADELGNGLQVIERNARVQKQLIEDLLDMSRIISGKVRLDVQRVELQPVIEAAVEAIRPASEAKGIRLQVTLDPIAGPVKGDPSRLQQVVWNLLSNAVKFTPRGGRVQLFLERVNSHLEIVVSDTGEGVPPEFLPHVFDRFRQADASTTRRHGGLGLGLSIVKQIAELHGGTVWAKSPGEGKGSTFMVMLPLLVLHENGDSPSEPRVHPATAEADKVECEEADLAGVTVLVVDDEPDARELVRRFLGACGAAVVTAGSADEAMALLRERRPRVLVSDIGMPGADGYELMRQVRSLPATQGGRTPAIALTAFARTEDRTRAMRAGYNVHLSKPTESTELVAAVASLAGLSVS